MGRPRVNSNKKKGENTRREAFTSEQIIDWKNMKEDPKDGEFVTVMLRGNKTQKVYFSDGDFRCRDHNYIIIPKDSIIFWGRYETMKVPLVYGGMF